MSNHLPWTEKEILVLGCGNILYGDDGFGPAVAENLKDKYSIPDNALVMDVGSSVREILFDVTLSEKVPKRIIIVDTLDRDKFVRGIPPETPFSNHRFHRLTQIFVKFFLVKILCKSRGFKKFLKFQYDKIPGEVFELRIEDIPENRMDDFSIHQVPSSNLLRELRDMKGIDIKIICAQAAHIPSEVQPGLSAVMKSVVVVTAELIYDRYLKDSVIKCIF